MKIMKALVWIGTMVLWGFLIGVGFWFSHKLTEAADNAILNFRARRIANKVVDEAEEEGVF